MKRANPIQKSGYFDWEYSQSILSAQGASLMRGMSLDVGVGEGEKTVFLRNVMSGIIAVELSPDRAQKARQRGLDIVVADALHLPFKSASFNVVTCFHVIEHVKSGAILVQEILRTLKSNGLYLLVTPNRGRLTAIVSIPLRLLFRRRYPLNPEHLHEYSINELSELARKTGLSSATVVPLFLGLMTRIGGKRIELGLRKPPSMMKGLCAQFVIYGFNQK